LAHVLDSVGIHVRGNRHLSLKLGGGAGGSLSPFIVFQSTNSWVLR
jgi:hypothetical protein